VIMGFVLTILFIIVTIISPEQFGKAWANYHALTYLAGITAFASLPSLAAYRYWKSSVQTFLLLGLVVAIGLSQIANGWLGGVLDSWRTFLPSASVFFFIVVNVTTVRRLKIITLVIVGSCMGVAIEALCGFYAGYGGDIFVLHNNIYNSADEAIGQLLRIRGAGFLSDPNDLAQILLIALPLIFIAWRQGRMFTNCLLVLVPSALLLWTTFLTHSRGGLIALAAVALIAARKKLGTSASTILAAVFIFGMLALDFTGGRGISAADGADRLGAWANGLEMFEHAPLFGIGFGNFTDFNEITAHNSFVLCLAELGILGSTLWLALLVTTTIGLNRRIGAQNKQNATGFFDLLRLFEMSYINNAGTLAGEPVAWEGTMFLKSTFARETLSDGELRAMAGASSVRNDTTADAAPPAVVPQHWVVAMRLALVSFMASSWFLSRSYTTTMYLVLGLATATIALQPTKSNSSDRGHWIFSTVALEVVLIILIYGLVRLRH
jgi:O-antigen ligase